MIDERTCPRCGASIFEALPRRVGRPRRWCSARCRRAASEERRAAAAGAIATEYVQIEVTIDGHVNAVLDSPAACRRVLRDLRERAEQGKLSDSRWSSVEAEFQRLATTSRRAATGLRWVTR